MNLELSFINREGELSDIESLPTIKNHCDSFGKPGEYRGEKIRTLSYNLTPSEHIPFSEITAIGRDNLKTRLIDLAKEYPGLLRNKKLELSIFITNSWSFGEGYIGEIKYKEVEDKLN